MKTPAPLSIGNDTHANPMNILKEALRDVELKFNFKPLSILLGPKDVKLFMQYILKNSSEFIDEKGNVQYPEQMLGLPVRLKSSNGIEFEMDPAEWVKFV